MIRLLDIKRRIILMQETVTLQTKIPPGESRINASASAVPTTSCSVVATSADLCCTFKAGNNESAATHL